MQYGNGARITLAQMMTRVGLGATRYPSPDGDACRVGCEPRVQKHNGLEREKNLAIKVNLTEFAEVRFSLRLIARVVCTFSTVLQSIFSFIFWVFLLLT